MVSAVVKEYYLTECKKVLTVTFIKLLKVNVLIMQDGSFHSVVLLSDTTRLFVLLFFITKSILICS